MGILVLIIGVFGLSSCASNPKEQITKSSIVHIENKDTALELEGMIDMRGSSRMGFLAITDAKSGTQYKILNPKKFNLKSKQNHTLALKVKLLKKAIGPGFPAEIEVLEVY